MFGIGEHILPPIWVHHITSPLMHHLMYTTPHINYSSSPFQCSLTQSSGSPFYLEVLRNTPFDVLHRNYFMCFEEVTVKQGSLKMASTNAEPRVSYNSYIFCMHKMVHKFWSVKGDIIFMHGIHSIQMVASVLFVALLRISLIVRHQSDLDTLLHGDTSQFEAWSICVREVYTWT